MTRLAKCGPVAACVLGLSLLASTPAAAQADFTRFVTVGDSILAGFTDACWVEHGQHDSIGAIVARQVGTTYEQPIISEPGLGGCLVLTSLAPTFTRKPSTGHPTNLTYPKPYNNLAVPGYKIKDVTDTKSSADNGNPLTDLVIRGTGATTLQLAAVQQPTFVIVYIGNNDVLGAATSGTAIEGATLTPFSVLEPRIDAMVSTLKASQGGTGKGIFVTVIDVTDLPFFTAIPPFITVGGKTITNPATGRPFTFLSQKVLKDLTIPTGQLGPVAPIPEDSLVTLQAAGFLATGFGIPCAILDAGQVPATDPRRLHCNQPLPDDANPAAQLPGVILYPDEIASIRARKLQINNKTSAAASAAGYKVFDGDAYFGELVAHGREFGGITITTSFLTGGFFSYDGIHPTSTGYAIGADDLIKFINENFGDDIPEPNMATYLFNGNSSAGGYPTGAFLTDDQKSAFTAAIFSPENMRTPLFPSYGSSHAGLSVGDPSDVRERVSQRDGGGPQTN